MAEWTAKRREKMWELIGAGDLDGLRKLASEHVGLRPSDFTPSDRKAIPALAKRLAAEPALHSTLTQMLDDTKGSVCEVAALAYKAADGLPDEEFVRRLDAFASVAVPKAHKARVDRFNKTSWSEEEKERRLKWNEPRLLPDDGRRMTAYYTAACNAPSAEKRDSLNRWSKGYAGVSVPDRVKFRHWKVETALEESEKSPTAPKPASAKPVKRAGRASKSVDAAASIRAALAGEDLDAIASLCEANPRLAAAKLGLEEGALGAWGERAAEEQTLQRRLLALLCGDPETGHLVAFAILRRSAPLAFGLCREAYDALHARMNERRQWGELTPPNRRRMQALFALSLRPEPKAGLAGWLLPESLIAWPEKSALAGALFESFGVEAAGKIAAEMFAERQEQAPAGKRHLVQEQRDGFLCQLNDERGRREPYHATTSFQSSLVGWQATLNSCAWLGVQADQIVRYMAPGRERDFFERHQPAINRSATLLALHREAPDFFRELFAWAPPGAIHSFVGIARFCAELLRDEAELAEPIATYLAACMEARTQLDVDWGFRVAFENPARLAPSGRTLFELVKVGLWGMNQSTARDSIRRLQAMAHAGMCSPEEAFEAIEEAFAMESPAMWNAAARGLKEMRAAHPGLALRDPGRVRELIERDPKKFAKTLKDLL